jgi:hypothetical protein
VGITGDVNLRKLGFPAHIVDFGTAVTVCPLPIRSGRWLTAMYHDGTIWLTHIIIRNIKSGERTQLGIVGHFDENDGSYVING